ncbi:MAG: FapA family protein, partial [Treponema sp.]|nr:FapA family protein [Treponema sp.]
MAALIAKGNASIVINPEETEAKLVFVPDSEGLGWDAAAVFKLIAERKLSHDISPKEIDPLLQKAARAKNSNPLETLLFRGMPPEEAEAEKAAWEPLKIPADIAPYREKTLAAAAKPELFRIKTEKIKKETLVKKPNPIPFLPPKEEMVVTWEKKETREAAEVNPEVRETRYAEKGQKLGTLTPPRPGKPGKSVFGKPIPPKPLADTAFFLGRGLVRNKNDIAACFSGFLRIGENWADLVPFAKHSWTAAKGSDGVTLYFNFEPGDSRFSPPSGKDVIEAAKLKGASESILVDAGLIDEAIRESLKTREPVLAFSLFKTQEAYARVDVSPDKLEAVLNLRKGIAGARPLEVKAISQALKDSNVKGYDAEKLKADIKAFMGGPDTELRNYVLVKGKEPSRGRDREVKLTVSLLEGAGAAAVLARVKAMPQSRLVPEGVQQGVPQGTNIFPLAEATGIVRVEKGAKIAQVVQPGFPEGGAAGAADEKGAPAAAEGPAAKNAAAPDAAGEAGRDVFGNTLPSLPGNDPELKLFRGLEQHGQTITASQGGLLAVKIGAGSFWGQILDYRDAKVVVTVSEDVMEAAADLYAELGAGEPLNVETLIKALAGAGVTKGIDRTAAEKACKLARAQGAGGCTGQILARGEPPVAKGSPAVKWLLPGIRPGTGAWEKSVAVKAGDPVAEITPAGGEGRPGFNVKGTVLPADKAVPAALTHDDSIGETPRGGGILLTAARGGSAIFDGKGLSISSVREIQGDVGKVTGNVSFSGELRITGKIEPGYSVMGGLHVFVGGSAEHALVSSGGRVLIAGGIRGGGRGIVRARTSIETAFVNDATLLAVEDIKVKAGCLRCNIKTNGRLLISGETGRLAGGVCKARRGVDTADIGSEKASQTEISFGQDYLIQDQIEVSERDIEKIKAGLQQTEAKLKQVAGDPAALNAARAYKVKLMKLLEGLNLKVFTLREKFEEHYDSEVRVRGTVYPGVVLESHNRYFEVNRRRSGVIFYFDRETGQIREKPLS